MNRLAIVYLSTAAVLTAGMLGGCRPRPTTKQPIAGFVAEIVNMLGKNGHACFDRGDEELCVARTTRPITAADALDRRQPLLLCTRVAGQLGDCRDLQAEPGLEYLCDGEACYCEGVASCMLLATDCSGKGTCGACAMGDCCCPQRAVTGPPIGAGPLTEMP